MIHDGVIKWKHYPGYWPFVRGIHRSPRNSPHRGRWRGALMFSLICAWINGWVKNTEAGDLRRHRAHYDVSVMMYWWLLVQGTKGISLQWVYTSQCTHDFHTSNVGWLEALCHFYLSQIKISLILKSQLQCRPMSWWFETQSRPLWRHCNGECRKDVSIN